MVVKELKPESGLFLCRYILWEIQAPSGRYIVAGPKARAEEAVQRLMRTEDKKYRGYPEMFEISEMIPEYRAKFPKKKIQTWRP